MNINRHNCEAWFLDYYENNLTPNQVTALFAFLDTYPDMRVVFESYEGSVFEDASDFTLTTFEGKELLKKQADLPTGINIANCEDYFIAATEGLLNDAKQKELDLFLTKHPHKKADLELFRTTKLQPDLTIKFDQKQGLKKSPVTISSADFDAYAVAALEGELTSDQQVAFEEFLKTNPSYQTEYTLFTQTKISPEKAIIFEHKAALKKQNASVTTENIDQFAACNIEGDLNEEDTAAFQTYLNTSTTAQTAYTAYTHYTQTHLQPDLSITYENKEELKQNETEKIVWFSSTRIRVAAAAAVVLFVFTYWLSNDQTRSGSVIVAGNFNVNSIQKGNTPNNLTESKDKNSVIETQSPKTGKGSLISSLSKEPQEKLSIAENEQKNNIPIKIAESPYGNQSTQLYAQVQTHNPNTENSINLTPSFQNQNTQTGISGILPMSYKSQKSISASQYLLRRIKKRLDHRKKSVDIHEENYEQIAIEDAHGENTQHVDGWDIAGSAIGKIGAVTGWNMCLKRNSFDGTTLSLGKYSVRLSRKGSN